MIYEVEGDILLTRAPVIVQGVSSNDAMTLGLARRLRERFPAMAEAYREWCVQENAEPGQLWTWGEPSRQIIINLVTHEGDGDPTRSGRPDKIAVNRCFRALNTLCGELRFAAMSMPTIGTGERGMDWAEVRNLMYSQLGELLIPVFVYIKQLDGQIAFEPGM